MDELFLLTKSLHQEEQNAIKQSFKTAKRDAEDGLLERLFNIIVSKDSKIKSDKNLSLLLYKADKQAALSKAKSRLFNFILEVLSSENILNKEKLFDPIDKQGIRIRKKMLQFRVLYRKKNKVDPSVLMHLLSEIIAEAKNHEQYDTLVEALTFKKYLLITRRGFEEVKEIEKQIIFFQKAYGNSVYANDIYFDIVTNQEVTRRENPEEFRKRLLDGINILDKIVEQTNSATIGYLKKLIKLELLVVDNKNNETIKLCNEILEHIQKTPHLNKKERIAEIYGNLSYCLILNEEYEKAEKAIKKAFELIPKMGTHYLISKQQEFFVNFYAEQYNNALKNIEELLSMPMMNTGEFRYNKFLFFKACTFFQQKQFPFALKFCNESSKVSKDKGRWDLGNRYLKILCFIELNDSDEAFSSIEALRKIIGRTKQFDFVTQRDELIYKLLYEYSKNNFSQLPSNKLLNIITELEKPNCNNNWKHYTHELFPIHNWIKKRLKTK